MKFRKINLVKFFAAILVLSTIGCSKDENSSPADNANQNGTISLKYLNSDNSVSEFQKSILSELGGQ